jgi:hypothetical protein
MLASWAVRSNFPVLGKYTFTDEIFGILIMVATGLILKEIVNLRLQIHMFIENDTDHDLEIEIKRRVGIDEPSFVPEGLVPAGDKVMLRNLTWWGIKSLDRECELLFVTTNSHTKKPVNTYHVILRSRNYRQFDTVRVKVSSLFPDIKNVIYNKKSLVPRWKHLR